MQKHLAAIMGVSLVAVAAGCGSTKTVVQTTTVTNVVRPAMPAEGDQRLYGRIDSMRLSDGRYELRFDPSLLVSGVTANTAQAEEDGTVCVPSACPPVPNDNYVVDEGHRLLVFILPIATRGTVLVKGGSTGFRETRITATQLAQLVAGKSPVELFEPLSSGVWILVHADTIRTFAQQYHP